MVLNMSTDVPYDQHNDETGQFEPTYSPEDFLEAVDELDLPTTAEVADHIGCAHRTALYHLSNLEEEERVDSRRAGRAKLWLPVE
jgi:predicted ArsR family transcriptional regulator